MPGAAPPPLARRAALPLLLAIAALVGACERESPPPPGGPVAGWPAYGGDPGGTRHSPLTQITRENVRALERAWTYRTGDLPPGPPGAGKLAFEATPVLDDGTLYLCTPLNKIVALDAESGAERWVFDARPAFEGGWTATCRGVAVWRDPHAAPGANCGRRVFLATVDARLVAVDAGTGRACAAFGRGGSVDLRAGIGEIEGGEYYVTSPPVSIGDVVAVGALVADNRRVDGPGGVVRGFDARSGALRWAFDPVPPGTPPLPPAPDGTPRFHRGTPNAWSIFSADPERGLLFVPMGGPSPDFYGGHRRGFDHYGSALVALDGATGRVAWSFQTVHHDLWDYDVASQPTLIELEREGARIPAVVQPTKVGHVFVLHRETGEPLFPVEERPVPQGDVPGERYAPTQPFPTFPPPLHPHRLSPEDAFGFTPWDRGHCRRKLAALRNDGVFTPPSFEGSLTYPGTPGGANWGSAAWDPDRRLLVLNQSRIGMAHRLLRREDVADGERTKYIGTSPQAGTPYAVRQDVPLSPFGVPCTPPPWGTLLAVDFAAGRVRWEVPFGTTRDLAPVPIPLRFGLPNMGGPIVTASGLVFIGAALDDYLRAYDVETGEELWRDRLPAGGQATPMTYRLRDDGRQYVVLAAGGHGTLGTTPGDWVIAWALP
jgi:quinoprotein glucose dehydrogenase